MEAEPTLVPGYKLDRYELLSPIASGGMASVWLARLRGKRGFEKLFAIKTIKTELNEDARFQEMFLDEARIASGIQHPNVAQIFDLGEQEDVLYIVMEWVDGDSLAKIRRLAEKNLAPIPLGITLRIIADACAGLHAAHQLADAKGVSLGVVHRDVSPQNIIVSSAGSVKVIDFGVAKARDRFAGETRGGVVKGKIRYMAPEQAQGHAIDRRADVWAIGVCLQEMLTGKLPFDGDSDIEVIRRLMSDEKPPRPEAALPDAIMEVLAHSIVRDPEERFATAAAMQRALEAAIDELGLPSTNEDVAEFMREHLLELETKRREAVTKALSASETRETGKSAVTAPVIEEVALAATVVSERGSAMRKPSAPKSDALAEAKTAIVSKDKTSPAVKKKKRARAGASGSRSDDSKATLVASVKEASDPPPKRGGSAVWAIVIVGAAGAGAWFGWPGEARLRAMIGSGRASGAHAARSELIDAGRRSQRRCAAPFGVGDVARGRRLEPRPRRERERRSERIPERERGGNRRRRGAPGGERERRDAGGSSPGKRLAPVRTLTTTTILRTTGKRRTDVGDARIPRSCFACSVPTRSRACRDPSSSSRSTTVDVVPSASVELHVELLPPCASTILQRNVKTQTEPARLDVVTASDIE